ncbi:MAG: endonuclease III [Candidatus Dormibacteria bacterium]
MSPRVAITMARPRRRRRPPGAAERTRATVDLLALQHPDPMCELDRESPLQLLVATILSAQTTDERVNAVTPALFARYPDAAALAGADPAEMQALIKSTGFFRAKTQAIIAMAHDLVCHYEGEVPPRMEDLVALRGVGRKTANVVLGVGFGIPGFPVDTHVTRLVRLLKLTSATDPVEIETDICAMLGPEHWTELSLRLILHGRRVCIARRPRCDVCSLNAICPSASVPGTARPPAQATPARASG